jgi:hypothetical protein
MSLPRQQAVQASIEAGMGFEFDQPAMKSVNA